MEIFGIVVGSLWDLIFGYLIPFVFVLAIVIFIHEMGAFPGGALVRRGGRGLLDRLRAGNLWLDR